MRRGSRSSPRPAFPVVNPNDAGVLESGCRVNSRINRGGRPDVNVQSDVAIEMPKIKVVKRKKGSRSRSKGARMMSPTLFGKPGSPGRSNGV